MLPTEPSGACTIVLRYPPLHQRTIGVSATDRLLGTCGFFAAFGEPGAGMRRWLLETNMSKAGFLQPPAAASERVTDLTLQWYNVFDGDIEFHACRAGRATACGSTSADRLRAAW